MTEYKIAVIRGDGIGIEVILEYTDQNENTINLTHGG